MSDQAETYMYCLFPYNAPHPFGLAPWDYKSAEATEFLEDNPNLFKKTFGEEMDDAPAAVETNEVDCWSAATSLARWCGLLDAVTIEILDNISDSWSVPIPSDLWDMEALYMRETWRILEQEYKVFFNMNYNARRLLDLSIQLRMHGIISEHDSVFDDESEEFEASCEHAAQIISKWCAAGALANTIDIPDIRRIKALRFRDTWTALELHHKVFRMHNKRTERLLNLAILYRMNGDLR